MPCLPQLVGSACHHLGISDFRRISKKTAAVDSILFTGGEPTLNPNLADFIAQAKTNGYKHTSLQTNGRLLRYKDFCEDILSSGLDEISISIQGSCSNVHDALTRTPGSFEETYRGIENICAIKKKYGLTLYVNFTLTRMNIQDLPCFIKMVRDLSCVDQIVLNTLMYTGNAKRYFSALYLTYRQIAAEIKKIRQGREAADAADLRVASLPACILENNDTAMEMLEIPMRVEGKRPISFKRAGSKVKRRECLSCTHYLTCDGIDVCYVDKFGWKEFSAVGIRKNG